MNRKAWIALCTAAGTIAYSAVAFPAPLAMAASTTVSQPLLKIGDVGSTVKTLQTELNLAGYNVGTADGIFGPGTMAAVEKLQQAHHLTASGVVDASTWAALQASMGPTASDLHTSSIYFNGKIVTSPAAFAWNNTTYMPIYYVIQLLKTINVQSQWDGTHWALTTAGSVQADVSGLPLNKPKPGQLEISLNGTPVAYVDGIVFTDPASNVKTTYMPIWYVMQALNRLNFKTNWNGQQWQLQKATAYYAYDKTGRKLGGPFPTESAAQALLLNMPGGTVEDDTGAVAFTEPDFTAYGNGGKTLLGDFTTLTAAESSVANIAGGIVKNSNQQVVYTTPDFTAYAKDGTTVLGQFTSLAAAQAAVANIPGGIVKDPTSAVVYTSPDFRAFFSPTQPEQDFVTLTQATAAVSSSPIGYVVDASSNTVVYGPASYDYVDTTGTWRNSQTGILGAAPSFAKFGYKYVSVSTSSSQSPQFYVISQANNTYVGTAVGSYQNPFQTVDLRFPAPASVTAAQIDSWLMQQNSPLQGLGQSFLTAQTKYGVDATYLVAHAIEETGWGRSAIAEAKNNLFGYGAYDANPANDAGMFPTDDYSIRYEAWVVRNNYLEPSGSLYAGPTLNGMNVNYASDPLWSQHIATLMSQYVSQTGGSATSYTQYSINNTPPIPAVSQEPVFLVQGAQGSTMQNPYGALPVWSDATLGGQQMFPGTLQYGDSGRGVRLLQEALINSDLQPDGQFGPMTQDAVKLWQQSHGLPATGICDFATWLSLFPAPAVSIPSGTTVVIDQMRQGLVGNIVTLWYHITAATGVSGWVDSSYVSPQIQNGNQTVSNLFRVAPMSGSAVPVYADETGNSQPVTTFHSGDEVVTSTLYPVNAAVPADANGYIQIRWVNQATGQPMVGYLKASLVQLTPLTPPANNMTGSAS
ncbi:peptidoglycan-binding protein [Alicyclobacillus curvatus]|jgi:mannosyl-glycoprotein endo-beta-N-acetylglucosaminidase|nr:peptidoglycan-binding protein [Alicyclobacillus curvatus]